MAAVSFLIVEVMRNGRLKEEKTKKEEQVAETENAQKQLERFEEEVKKLEAKAKYIENRIFKDNKMPVKLIKELTVLGNEAGFGKIEFIYKSKKEKDADKMKGVGEQAIQAQARLPANQQRDSALVEPLFITMSFEGDYISLISFLKKVFELDTLAVVKNIKVNRVKKLLPRQEISVEFSAYAFVNQPE